MTFSAICVRTINLLNILSGTMGPVRTVVIMIAVYSSDRSPKQSKWTSESERVRSVCKRIRISPTAVQRTVSDSDRSRMKVRRTLSDFCPFGKFSAIIINTVLTDLMAPLSVSNKSIVRTPTDSETTRNSLTGIMSDQNVSIPNRSRIKVRRTLFYK